MNKTALCPAFKNGMCDKNTGKECTCFLWTEFKKHIEGMGEEDRTKLLNAILRSNK